MRRYRIQDLASLEQEMRAVARGERAAPADAGKPSFNSVDALVRLLTPENRQLLALIRDRKPGSVAELVQMTGRAQPNLTRTLAKLEAAGFIRMTVPVSSPAAKEEINISTARNQGVFAGRNLIVEGLDTSEEGLLHSYFSHACSRVKTFWD